MTGFLTENNVVTALILTLLAGLATGLGGVAAVISRVNNTRFLSAALGLSAGVMIYVTFVEILPEAAEGLGELYGETCGMGYALTAFLGGMILMALVDFLVPENSNSHVLHDRHHCPADDGEELSQTQKRSLKRTGLMLVGAISIHNFPEGVATFVSALDGIEVALPILIAISIHNIPMGIAMAAPLHCATGSRLKAIGWSVAAGLTSLLGAVVALLFLLPFWNPTVASVCIAGVGGVMVFIAFDELLPGAEAYGHHHYAMAGVIAGLAVMGFSLLII